MACQRLTWPQALLLCLAVGLLLMQGAPVQAQAKRTETEIRSNADWRQWRESMLELRHRDARSALQLLRSRYEDALARGDRHAGWLYLAWLTRETAAADFATSAPLLTLADQAIAEALHADDKMAAFELMLMVESTRVAQQNELPREASLSQALALADTLGDPQREGLILQLRGVAAAQSGQQGEALYQYQRALPLFDGRFDRAEILYNMAQALYDSPAVSASKQALGYLHEIDQMLPAERYPSLVNALVAQSLLLARVDRPQDALTAAERATVVARQVAMATPVALAQVAYGHALLSAGEVQAAIDRFRAVSMEALNLEGKLSAIAGGALALARLEEAQEAQALLARGYALVQAQSNVNTVAIAQFYESSSRTHQMLGNSTGALDDLARAGVIRSSMANAAREKLLQAQLDAESRAAEAQSRTVQRQQLTLGVLLLATAVLGAGGLALHQFRQRRVIAVLSGQMEAANEQLQRFNAARSRHLAAACHDLRQPAHVLGLATEAVAPGVTLSADELQARVSAVRRCSRTLTDMLDALMDMTQLERGAYMTRIEVVDLGELLAEVDFQYGLTAREKGLAWHVSPTTGRVLSDRQLLRRIIFNLASNAVRYSSQGGVEIIAATLDNRVLIDVVDSGPGIPVDRLLGEGAGLDFGASDSGSLGLGMGLSIVRMACQMLGHELTVPLSSPQGSVVRIGMVLAPADDTAREQPAQPLRGRRALVVEPDPAVGQTLREALVAQGMAVVLWGDLAEAIQASGRDGGGDFLIIDTATDDMASVARQVRAWRSVTQSTQAGLVLLTDEFGPDIVSLALACDAELVYKPVSAPSLVARLDAMAAAWRAGPGMSAASAVDAGGQP